MDAVELAADPLLLGLEEVEGDGACVVGVEELLAPLLTAMFPGHSWATSVLAFPLAGPRFALDQSIMIGGAGCATVFHVSRVRLMTLRSPSRGPDD